VNDETHGRLTPMSVRKVLKAYRRQDAKARSEDSAVCADGVDGDRGNSA
jgi:hypothetical protein